MSTPSSPFSSLSPPCSRAFLCPLLLAPPPRFGVPPTYPRSPIPRVGPGPLEKVTGTSAGGEEASVDAYLCSEWHGRGDRTGGAFGQRGVRGTRVERLRLYICQRRVVDLGQRTKRLCHPGHARAQSNGPSHLEFENKKPLRADAGKLLWPCLHDWSGCLTRCSPLARTRTIQNAQLHSTASHRALLAGRHCLPRLHSPRNAR